MSLRSDVPFYRFWSPPNPAAGVDWTFTPGGKGWVRIVSFNARIVTSAAAGNRRLTVGAHNGTRKYWSAPTNSNIGSTATVDFGAAAGVEAVSFTSAVMGIGLPNEGLYLPPGARIFMQTDAIQAGDQWSDIEIFGQEFPTGPAWEMFPGLFIQRQERV